jgi:hypothetical protein
MQRIRNDPAGSPGQPPFGKLVLLHQRIGRFAKELTGIFAFRCSLATKPPTLWKSCDNHRHIAIVRRFKIKPPGSVQPPAFASEPAVLNATWTAAGRALRRVPLHTLWWLAWLRPLKRY